MIPIALAWHQFRYDQRIFWRNPASVFFTVLLPVVFLLIFATIFGDELVDVAGGIETTTYYVPAIITLAVISATTVNLAINLTRQREAGLIKRIRATPLPFGVFIAGRIGNAVVVSAMMLALLAAIGRLAYGVALPWSRAAEVLATLAVGAAAFCAIGIALTALIPSEEAAPAVTNALVLPLYFLSGVFIPEDEIPAGVLAFADAFPIRHFFEAFFSVWVPGGGGLDPGSLAVVAAWGLAAAVIGWRAFRWTPRHG